MRFIRCGKLRTRRKNKMIKAKAKTTGTDTQKVDLTVGGSTHEVVCELAAICCTVIQDIKPQLKVPLDEFVEEFAKLVRATLKK